MTRVAIQWNSPLTLSFALICIVIAAVNTLTAGVFVPAFVALNQKGGLLGYTKLLTYVFGHSGWPHLISNFSYILLVGPAVEERYGAQTLLVMAAITAVVSGAFSIFVLGTGLVGSSGIVFLLILLVSFANSRTGAIPATFIAVSVLFLGREVVAALQPDNVSQFAHLAGGACGAVFGFALRRR